jgi:protein-S-isoprenylcysteine O-methyltransferase Ste14
MDQQLRQNQKHGKHQYRAGLYLKTATILAIIALCVAGLAGRWDWWTGWIFLGVFTAYCLILFRWLSAVDPELTRERQQDIDERNQPYERLIIPAMIALELALIIIAVLDNGRFGWSNMPTWIRVVGWTLVAFTGIMLPWVFRTNTFASGVGRIQDDRNHHVITSGPYRYVRHPMYAGVCAAFVGLPLVMGSWWALIPGVLLAALFMVRTALEDRMLHEQLPGYARYAHRVRFRLIPRIW